MPHNEQDIAAQETAFTIKEHYENEKAKLLTQTFDLVIEAMKIEQAETRLPASISSQLSERELRSHEAAAIANRHKELRQQLKERYIELDLELRSALELRGEAIQEELAPKGASFTDLAAAASASPDALVAAFDMAESAGDELA